MNLDLTRTEAFELRELIDERLRQMLLEISHTDVRAYRSRLIARATRLELLNRRLTYLLAKEPTEATPNWERIEHWTL